MARDLNQLADRILSACEPDGTGCLIWTGARLQKGYGTFRPSPGAKTLSTHRTILKWKLGGNIPPGMLALHSCDKPPCCNPDHLRAGTAAENSLDMVQKGRSPRGVRQGRARFTDEQVIDLRRRYATGETQRNLAREHRVNQSMVSRAVNGVTWSHVEAGQ